MKRTRVNSPNDNRRGAAMVEMALMLPVFLVLTFAIIELGWLMYVRQSMNFAAREAVRTMAVRGYTDVEAEAYAKNYLSTLANYSYSFTTSNPDNGSTVTMEIRVPVQDVSLLGGRLVPGSTIMRGSAELVRETSY
jgi:Flp pilus assembly protein TadG